MLLDNFSPMIGSVPSARYQSVEIGMRTLLIVGATSIIKLAKRGLKVPLWIRTMLQRRPVKVVSVALANKIARTIWALLVRGGIYQAPAAMLKS